MGTEFDGGSGIQPFDLRQGSSQGDNGMIPKGEDQKVRKILLDIFGKISIIALRKRGFG
jgi:hypothetical protein